MCTPEVRKEANRLNWMIKGKLIDISESDSVVEYIHDSYFKRLWGNIERSGYGLEGFEAAYEIRLEEALLVEMKNVACLGYN